MKKTFIYTVCLVCTAAICHAQIIDLKPAPAPINIDGNVTEWGDMPYSDEKAKVTYTLSNDKDNLYLVVKTKDPVKQGNILGSGITLSIDTKGRKKTTYAVTFPLNDQTEETGYMNMSPDQMQAKAALTKFRKISATGFSAINDVTLGVSNPYGIQAAVSYDETGCLTYEEAIPLTLFNAVADMKKEWAANIQVNGLETKIKMGQRNVYVNRSGSASSTGRGLASGGVGMGIDATDPDNLPKVIQLTPSADFWVKFNLAKIL